MYELDNEFTLKNKPMRGWLVAVVLLALAVVVLFPPSFWLSGLGAVLLVVGQIANSARTGQWMS